MATHQHLIQLLDEQRQEINGLTNGVRLTLYLLGVTEAAQLAALGAIIYLLI